MENTNRNFRLAIYPKDDAIIMEKSQGSALVVSLPKSDQKVKNPNKS